MKTAAHSKASVGRGLQHKDLRLLGPTEAIDLGSFIIWVEMERKKKGTDEETEKLMMDIE